MPDAAATAAEQAAMRRALEVAATPGVPLGPNPRVGCVLLDADGRRGRRGVPPRRRAPARRGRGAPRARRTRARGLTAVVTLEPCNHTGRTGPCSQALLEAGSHGSSSPSPTPTRWPPEGRRPPRRGGVEVVGGAARRRGAAVNRAWTFAVEHGRPFVTWKLATTPRRAQRRRRRHQPLDQQRGRPARHPPAARRVRRGPGRHRHGARRRPAADRARRDRRSRCPASGSRCARSWGCATCPPASRVLDDRRRDRPPAHPRPARGARRAPRPGPAARLPRGRSPARRGVPRGRAGRRGRRLRRARCCSAAAPTPSRDSTIAHDRRRAARLDVVDVTVLGIGPDRNVRLTLRPGPRTADETPAPTEEDD